MTHSTLLLLGGLFSVLSFMGCSTPLPWPESPLHTFPELDPEWAGPANLEAAMRAIEGHYAHYDVVAYEDFATRTPMRTLVASYGFTDFSIQDGKLFQTDTFCFANQKINQKNITSSFGDKSVQAIQPRTQEVKLRYENGQWHIYRPASPTLLGITGDPSLPLSKDPEDPNIVDTDADGNPGVTVNLKIGNLINGEIYITRREIYEYDLTLNSNGNLYGHVEDSSEQFVVGASIRILRQQSSPTQIPDPRMNPIMLIRVADEIDTCQELKENIAQLFPQEPEFLATEP